MLTPFSTKDKRCQAAVQPQSPCGVRGQDSQGSGAGYQSHGQSIHRLEVGGHGWAPALATSHRHLSHQTAPELPEMTSPATRVPGAAGHFRFLGIDVLIGCKQLQNLRRRNSRPGVSALGSLVPILFLFSKSTCLFF